MSSRLLAPLIAAALGVGTGYYVFQPLLSSYRESTQGSFRPEDDHHAAPVPPLPYTSLQPGKTVDGKDLLPPPAQELPLQPKREV